MPCYTSESETKAVSEDYHRRKNERKERVKKWGDSPYYKGFMSILSYLEVNHPIILKDLFEKNCCMREEFIGYKDDIALNKEWEIK